MKSTLRRELKEPEIGKEEAYRLAYCLYYHRCKQCKGVYMTRLETRTKESNNIASIRGKKSLVRNESEFRLQVGAEFIVCERWCQDPKDGELCLSRMKSGETLMEVHSATDVQIVRVTWVQGRKTNRTIQQLVPSEVSLRIAGVINAVLPGKANDQRFGGHVAFHLFSNFKWVSLECYLIEHLGKMQTLSGPFLVSRTGDEGCSQSFVKVPNYMLIRYHKRCWFIKTAGRWSWKSKPAKECVTTHLPNGLALKMDGAAAYNRYKTVVPSEGRTCRRAWTYAQKLLT